ncbi:hypothetical protein HMPREF9413_4765 [Paenibacillus sp. HGF7]|nr:hypothetical protein HMPREF9413_4765 [Paenibacillus sp. HGF7]
MYRKEENPHTDACWYLRVILRLPRRGFQPEALKVPFCMRRFVFLFTVFLYSYQIKNRPEAICL